MLRTKELGRNGFQRYTPDMGDQARERVELQAALRRAVEGQRFELHYQPQVDTTTGRIVAVEALIRWTHPELGPISPDRFIPLAEDVGLIVPISEWVLQTACRQLQAWRTAGHTELMMAINLSTRQFDGHDIPQRVAQALLETAVPAERLELELTEGVENEDQRKFLAALKCDRVQGFHFARPMPAAQIVALLSTPVQSPACDLLLDALTPEG